MVTNAANVTPAPEELVLATPELRLAARAWGPPDGLPVLATHGWLDNAASFDRLAPLLLAAHPGLRIVALDWPGHGRSQHLPLGASYHFVELVETTLLVADTLGWPRFRLLAHSLGAAVGPLLLGAAPERVERAVFLEGLGPIAVPAEQAPDQLVAALRDRARLRTGDARVYPSLEAAIDRMLEGEPKRVRETARLLAERGTERVPGGVRFSHDRRLRAKSALRLTEEQVLAFLRRIRCPVLVVRAADGWPTDPEQTQARYEAIPDRRLLRVAGGHHVHLAHPERLADGVGRFLCGEEDVGER